jgi:RimJ/RimL family protein N-acetyltransferase
MLGDPQVMRFVGGKSLSREEAWRRLIGCAGLWPILGYGYWSLERKSDGIYLGQVGFGDFKRELSPPIENTLEMGWLLIADAHGQGVASEAVAAAIHWAERAFPALEITAIIAPDNAPSIRVAEKAGFVRGEETAYHGEPILIFRRSVTSVQPIRLRS